MAATRNEQTQDAARQAVVALRKSLGRSQQQFAALLKTAVTTVARYETSHPPSGQALLRLAHVAKKNGKVDLSTRFLALYLEEVLSDPILQPAFVTWGRRTGLVGYFAAKLQNWEQLFAVIDYMERFFPGENHWDVALGWLLETLSRYGDTENPRLSLDDLKMLEALPKERRVLLEKMLAEKKKK